MKAANENDSALVVQFTAVWCPPCRIIAPLVEEQAVKNPNIGFYKLDTDNEDLYPVISRHAVSSVPTFVSYLGGRLTAAFSGADKDALLRMIQDLNVKV